MPVFPVDRKCATVKQDKYYRFSECIDFLYQLLLYIRQIDPCSVSTFETILGYSHFFTFKSWCNTHAHYHNICFFCNIQRFQILLMEPKGTHINDKKVNYYQTSGVKLEFPTEVPFHVDGELNFSRKFDVRILTGCLKK